MNAVSFQNVTFRYGEKEVLHDLSVEIPRGEFLTVIGRSGCGKTTFLKLINGLLLPSRGTVLTEGENVAQTDLIALRRRIGYAIQGIGLFPHMTVEKNIAYVPSLDGLWTRSQRKERVAQLLELVGLEPDLAGVYPHQLSGGQRQRVGIARALAADPPLLLLDEPFGAVDEITRTQLQEQILALHAEKGFTAVFITHDISEALRLGTQILVLEEGRVAQMAPPETLKQHPANDFIARLLSSSGKQRNS